MTLSETATDRNGLHQIEMLGKEAHGMSQTIQAVAKAIACPPQTDGKSLLLKRTPKYLTEYREDNLGPN